MESLRGLEHPPPSNGIHSHGRETALTAAMARTRNLLERALFGYLCYLSRRVCPWSMQCLMHEGSRTYRMILSRICDHQLLNLLLSLQSQLALCSFCAAQGLTPTDPDRLDFKARKVDPATRQLV